MPEAIAFSLADHIALITLNRPERANAINHAMRKEIQDAYHEVKENAAIWVVILTGAGRVFCSGKDLFEAKAADDGAVMSNDELYLYQRSIYKPFIAALNGPCYAQGGGFALMSDVRIFSERATLGWPQVLRGISSVSGPTLFAAEVGLAAAMPYLLRGVPVTAQEALSLHIAQEVVPHEQLLAAAYRWAHEILEAAPLAVQAVKEAAIRGQDLPLDERIPMARAVADRVLESRDSREGILAFKEKRPPVWTGS